MDGGGRLSERARRDTIYFENCVSRTTSRHKYEGRGGGGGSGGTLAVRRGRLSKRVSELVL